MHNHRHGHWTVGTLVCVPVCSVMPDSSRPRGMEPTRLLCPWRFSSQNYGAGLPGPPPGDLPNPGIFPTQGSNPGLPHCRWTLYSLSEYTEDGQFYVICISPLFSKRVQVDFFFLLKRERSQETDHLKDDD